MTESGKIYIDVKEVLLESISEDYIDNILDIIFQEVYEDLITSADKNYSKDDIRMAIGRTLIKEINNLEP